MVERFGEPAVQPLVPPPATFDDYFVTGGSRVESPQPSAYRLNTAVAPPSWPPAAPPRPSSPVPPRRSTTSVWLSILVALALLASVALVRAHRGVGTSLGSGEGVFGAVTEHPPMHDVIDPNRILPKPAVAAGTGGYTVLSERNGTAVAWDPCEPIHFVVRPDNEIPGGRVALDQAIAEISRDTGLYFTDDGTTTEAPAPSRNPYQPDRYGKNWAPVLIGWSNEAEYPALAGDVVGLAGPISVGGKDARVVSGEVVFDSADLTKIENGPDGATYVHDVLLHELGHLVGLGHVEDPNSVMNPVTRRPLAGYSAGDLRGLATLGSGRCFGFY